MFRRKYGLRTLAIISISLFILPMMIVHAYPTHSKTDMNLDNTDIQGKRIYLYSNLTLNQSDCLLGENHELCFPHEGTFFIFLDSNITLSNEVVFSKNAIINIINTNVSRHVEFSNVNLRFNGSLNIDSSRVCFVNSTLGNNCSELSLNFTDDRITAIHSIFDGARQLSPSSYVTSKASNGGQPISASECCKLAFKKYTWYRFPVTSLCEIMNYDLIGKPVNISTSFLIDGRPFILNTTLAESHTSGRFSINVSNPFYVTARSNDYLKTNFTYSYEAQLTIWNYTLKFISNSTLNFTGFSHNYIMLYHTSMVSINSSIGGNSRPFWSSGILNFRKTGVMENCHSNLTLVGSDFPCSSGLRNPPVLISGNSTFYFVPVLRVSYESLGVHHELYSDGIIGNSTFADEIMKEIESIPDFKLTINYSYLLGAYENGQQNITQNVFMYSIYNYSSYVSLKTSTILETKVVCVRKSFHNVSSLSTGNFLINRGESSLNVSVNMSYNMFVPTPVSINFSVAYNNQTSVAHYELMLNKNNSEISINRTIHGINVSGEVEVEVCVQYYNGFRTIQTWKNNTFLLPTMKYAFTLVGIGLPSSLQFSIHEDNATFQSVDHNIQLNSTRDSITIGVSGEGYYIPVESEITVNSGSTAILFELRIGTIFLYDQGFSSPRIYVDQNSVENHTIRLPYGNYTVKVDSSTGNYSFNVSLTLPKIYINVVNVRQISWIIIAEDFIPIISASMLVAALFNYVRVKYWRICKICMVPVRLGEHHMHRKNLKK